MEVEDLEMNYLRTLPLKGLCGTSRIQVPHFEDCYPCLQLSHQIRCPKVKLLVSQLCLTLWYPKIVAHQAPLSMEFSRQAYWSGLPYPPPGESSQSRD